MALGHELANYSFNVAFKNKAKQNKTPPPPPPTTTTTTLSLPATFYRWYDFIPRNVSRTCLSAGTETLSFGNLLFRIMTHEE